MQSTLLSVPCSDAGDGSDVDVRQCTGNNSRGGGGDSAFSVGIGIRKTDGETSEGRKARSERQVAWQERLRMQSQTHMYTGIRAPNAHTQRQTGSGLSISALPS